MLGLTDTDILMMLWGLLQVIVIAIGAWILSTLLALKILMAEIKIRLETQDSRIHDLEVYKQFAESKLKEMWSKHTREARATSKPNIDPYK